MSSDFVFNKEYPLSDLVVFVNEKIDSTKVSLDKYISTDNMITDRGGVETAIKLPSATKFHHFKPTDTLFSNIRTYFRKVWFAEFEGGASPDVLVFRAKDPKILDPTYLFYLLSDKKFSEYTVLTSKGAKMPRGDKAAIMQYKVFVPESNVQRAISGALRAYDLKLTTNTQINQTLEQMAQAIFKSWFVDFDPVKAKIKVLEAGGSQADAELAAMSAISAKSVEELTTFKESDPEAYAELAQTAALFPSAMQDSELGEIPEGWEVSTIGEEVKISGGGTPSTKNQEYWENGSIHWTTPKDLSNLTDKVLTDTERKITESGLGKISSGLLPVDTVLMSSRAPVGYLALAKIPVAINQGYIAMQCERRLSPEFILQWANSNMDEIKQRASGTTFAEISKKNFRPISVVVPPADVVSAYSRKAKTIYDKIYALLEEMKTLSSIRDTALPPLLYGEIDFAGGAL